MVERMDRSAEISAVAALLNRSGGYADRRSLVTVIGRHGLDRVLGAGVLRRVARGLYASPHSAASPAQLAARHSAVLTGLSAAKHLGWELLREPPIVEAAVRHHRPLRWVKGIRLRRRTFRENEIHEDICTAPLRTVLDCAATLPMDEAVSVADSALRHGDVDPDDLRTAALSLSSRIRRRVIRVVEFASGAAANPFESALRVRSADAGLTVRPQTRITTGSATYRVDLADVGRRVVIEGDSFTFHAGPEAFRRDCVRYSELVAAGWTVLRMPYRHVCDEPAWCLRVLGAVATLPTTRAPR